MPQQVSKIRVFVASPGDVDQERDRLERVVGELNRTLGQAEGVVLELVRWETHAWPGFGRDAQDVINQQIDPFDIFIGIMWKRLGTPTARAASGTVEEFERAYLLWQSHRVPQLMFYFSRAPFFPTADELEQLQGVMRFKEMLGAKGALWWEYGDVDDFEATAREHLYREVRRSVVVARSQQLTTSLDEEGLALELLTNQQRSLDDVPDSDEIRRLLSSVLRRVQELDDANARRTQQVPPTVLLDAARGLLAAQKWEQAADYFDRYVEADTTNWDAIFARAVARANSRQGPDGDLMALRAYNDAIALRPSDLAENLLARLYSYRGAMLKRLGRPVEAEADLLLARTMATDDYERADIAYNLACVYAMMGDRRADVLPLVESLRGTQFIGAVRANKDRYFASLADDPDFLGLL
jgi:tetratricopeptide (TPR) repeat protein